MASETGKPQVYQCRDIVSLSSKNKRSQYRQNQRRRKGKDEKLGKKKTRVRKKERVKEKRKKKGQKRKKGRWRNKINLAEKESSNSETSVYYHLI